jgi:hypothetical protein
LSTGRILGILQVRDQGKPLESAGRKATDLQEEFLGQRGCRCYFTKHVIVVPLSACACLRSAIITFKQSSFEALSHAVDTPF